MKKGVNDHTIVDLARHFHGTGHIVRFIEFMDVGTTNGWRLDDVIPARQIVDRINVELPIEPLEPNYQGQVARTVTISASPSCWRGSVKTERSSAIHTCTSISSPVTRTV